MENFTSKLYRIIILVIERWVYFIFQYLNHIYKYDMVVKKVLYYHFPLNSHGRS